MLIWSYKLLHFYPIWYYRKPGNPLSVLENRYEKTMAYVTYIEDLGRFFFSCKILRLSICGYDNLKTTSFLLAPYADIIHET